MSDHEYEHIEHKQSLGERHEATVAIAAFATARGGTVQFGISPSGRRTGVQLGRTSLEELANYIRQNTDPPQYPSITVDGEEASAVVTVHVEESPIKPVWAFGKPYKRVGRTNQSLSRPESQRLTDQTTGRTWDALPCEGLTTDALDRHAVEDFLRRSGQNTDTSTESVLENLRMRLPNGSLCNAAALLFAAKPWHFLTGVQVKCARFRGTTSVDFLDERTIEGAVLTQLDEALAFITRNTRQAIRITGRLERETVPEYVDIAVREAITNSICHRDYTASGTVQVRIYDDRLEVWNPATLAGDLTIEKLYHEHPSRPPNRRLADAFYRARLIEHWGTGTVRMVQACEAQGMPTPDYRYDMGMFMVRFPSPTISLPRVKDSTAQDSELSERQREALTYMAVARSLTRKQYEEKFEVSKRQALRDLEDLVEQGCVTREGRNRSIRYIITDQCV